jgi:precorrin-2 dehydrogenase/sirohydrochlorin ferrochelatase
MSYYPIFVDLKGRKVIVIGGGTVAQRKIESLLDYGADIHVLSRELTPALRRMVDKGTIGWIGPEFHDRSLQGAFLVIAATDDPLLNRRVGQVAKQNHTLVNAVDQPSDCSFIVPSVLRRGDLTIAVSTSGKSPALARKIRETLTGQFGEEYGAFLELMGRLRKEILQRGLSQKENSRIFHELVNSSLLDGIHDKNYEEVASLLSGILGRRVSADDVKKYLKAE